MEFFGAYFSCDMGQIRWIYKTLQYQEENVPMGNWIKGTLVNLKIHSIGEIE